MTWRTARRPSGSTPAVGSSRNTTSGRPTRASARDSRCCSPPDSRRHGVRATASQAYQVEQRLGVLGVVVVVGEEAQHAARSHDRVDPAALEHDAHAGHQATMVGGRVETEHPHRPRRGAAVALEGLDRRRLARPVGPEQGEHLPALRPQRQSVDGDTSRRSARRDRGIRRRPSAPADSRGEATVAHHDRHPPGQGATLRAVRPPWPAGASIPVRGASACWTPTPRPAGDGKARRAAARRSRSCRARWAKHGAPATRRVPPSWPSAAAPWARRRSALDAEADAAQAEVRELLLVLAQPAGRRGARRRATARTTRGARGGPTTARRYADASAGAALGRGHRARPPRPRTGRQAVGVDVPALPRRRGPADPGAHRLRPRPPRRRLRGDPAPHAGAHRDHGVDGAPAQVRRRRLPPRARRPVGHSHRRGAAHFDVPRRDPRRVRAPHAADRRSPRVTGARQERPGATPRAAAGARVRQGRAVRLRHRRAGAGEHADMVGRAETLLRELWSSSTGSSTCAPATSATPRPAPSTSRCTHRGATCGSRCPR